MSMRASTIRQSWNPLSFFSASAKNRLAPVTRLAITMRRTRWQHFPEFRKRLEPSQPKFSYTHIEVFPRILAASASGLYLFADSIAHPAYTPVYASLCPSRDPGALMPRQRSMGIDAAAFRALTGGRASGAHGEGGPRTQHVQASPRHHGRQPPAEILDAASSLASERLSLRPRLLMSEPYLRDEMPGCSQEKTKSVIPGNILVINPIRGAKPKPTILNQNSDPNSPGFVLVTWLNVASRCISA
jgi:hypothetical protein